MHYWDTSALVALFVREAETERLLHLARNNVIATWALSRVEVASAIERRARAGTLSAADRATTLARLEQAAESWNEVTGLEAVRDRAGRLLAVHPLRAADALQLAAALVAVSDRPKGHVFVCSDKVLLGAAGREGFTPA